MDLVGTVAFSLFGAAAIAWGLYSLVQAYRSAQWPKAIGTITSSAVEEQRDSKGTMMYRPAITYRYSVSGREYVSSRRIFGGEMGVNWPGPAEKTIARYPAGAAVTIHYDPRKPGEAVLEPGQYKIPLFAIVFGAVFLILGLFVW
jgi:hypothetical protein